ncbi:hypothetical protein [Lentiprolixibacter aurantiacus]|uniref:Uncharacterized protein n=1 Tax=Lentiprolixibacter aurantiacus TaxID=2993939 RepID=A0AAE3MIV3_9FLAO|nr:hypothetical protein [Lentiprolixibacter aurantiacus]MCX2718600.1 hypothetical protein [Lentiprolixibacter aurantiacus]
MKQDFGDDYSLENLQPLVSSKPRLLKSKKNQSIPSILSKYLKGV